MARELIAANLIDTYHLAIIPIILGKGIRLFDSTSRPIELTLTDTKEYNGITELIYNRRKVYSKP
ncbi:MAG: dihydrofolate reductase family protein [Duncaniella sp.]|nr:dihydrofolate reductase family protein [Duncaniella sp.]